MLEVHDVNVGILFLGGGCGGRVFFLSFVHFFCLFSTCRGGSDLRLRQVGWGMGGV